MQVVPESLLAWQRVRLACTMAKGGREWAKVVARHNSGTYNNQYMVFDSNKFVRGQELQDEALYVVCVGIGIRISCWGLYECVRYIQYA